MVCSGASAIVGITLSTGYFHFGQGLQTFPLTVAASIAGYGFGFMAIGSSIARMCLKLEPSTDGKQDMLQDPKPRWLDVLRIVCIVGCFTLLPQNGWMFISVLAIVLVSMFVHYKICPPYGLLFDTIDNIGRAAAEDTYCPRCHGDLGPALSWRREVQCPHCLHTFTKLQLVASWAALRQPQSTIIPSSAQTDDVQADHLTEHKPAR